MRGIKKFIVFMVAFLIVIPIGALPKVGGSIASAEQVFYVRVDITDPNQFKPIEDSGMNIIEKYPAYVYGKATATQFNVLLENKLMAVRLPNSDPVYIAGKALYPKNDDSKEFLFKDIPEGLGAKDLYESTLHYYLVKFKAPAKNEWIQEIRLKGVEVLEYFHNDAYVLRMEPKMAGEISTIPYISAMTEFLPYFKLPSKFNVGDLNTFVFTLHWKGVNLERLRFDIEKYAEGKVLGENVCEDFSTFLVWVNMMNIPNLARIPDIEYIEFPPDKMELKVDIAKQIIGMNWVDQEYTSGNIPVRLDGSGEIVAVFDSGLDTGYIPDINANNPDFAGRVIGGVNYGDCSNSYSICYYGGYYTQRVCCTGFQYLPNFNYTNWCDVWGHGTHVAGIIAGTGARSPNNQYRGVAPGARLLIQRMTGTWSLYDYNNPRPTRTNIYPPPNELPAKAHPCIARPVIWDYNLDLCRPGIYARDQVPYKYELSPLPPEEIPPLGPYPSFHDVPNVAGEVYGPSFGGAYGPEEGCLPSRHPGSPFFSGAAGTFNYAMTRAYVNGARIMNNSWWWYFLRTRQGYSPDPGSETFSTYDYNMISKFVDNFQYYQQDFLTVWAAGDNARDRDKDQRSDIAKDLNYDLTTGDPWITGENQTFFAPAPVKNGITVGACENYRPNINLVYGKKQDANRANFGLFFRDGDTVGGFPLQTASIGQGYTITENPINFYAPDWEGVIRNDEIADGNAPPDAPEREFDSRFDITDPNSDYWSDQTLDETDGKFAMWALSTRGPTSDGRIKPDLVAPGTMIIGPLSRYATNSRNRYPFEHLYTSTSPANSNYAYMSGTSTSAAFVSGAAAIVRQYYRQIEGLTVPPTPTAALVKATLIHGATNMAERDYPNQYDIIEENRYVNETYNDVTARPDFNQGWGRLNVYKSLFPKAPKIQKYDDNTTGVDTDVATYKVYVDNLDVPFEATLVWTDESANPNSWPVLKHNLDLIVVDPAGLVYRGNQFGVPPQQDPNVSVPMATTSDTLNNVERIVIREPKIKGEYTISVVPSSLPKAPGGPVKYALIYSGGFTSRPEELPIPATNKIGLGILAIALLFFGIFEIRKAKKVVAA